jgi:hypothetical protein
LLDKPGWFRVAIAAEYVAPDRQRDLAHLPLWQRLAAELVREYVARVYDHHKRAWQTMEAKVVWWEELDEEDKLRLVPEGQFSEAGARHSVMVAEDPGRGSDDVVQFVRDIATEVGRGQYDVGRKHGLRALGGLRSLYHPLLALDGSQKITIRCQPVALNPGEEAFVSRLDQYLASNPALLAGTEVHLLRNESRKGLGFFVGAGFYPDFLLWIVRGATQFVVFIDPKGATHMATSQSAAKLTLPELLWEIEKRNGLADVRLDAFLVFGTRAQDLDEGWVRDHAKRIVFAENPNYIEQIVTRVLARG